MKHLYYSIGFCMLLCCACGNPNTLNNISEDNATQIKYSAHIDGATIYVAPECLVVKDDGRGCTIKYSICGHEREVKDTRQLEISKEDLWLSLYDLISTEKSIDSLPVNVLINNDAEQTVVIKKKTKESTDNLWGKITGNCLPVSDNSQEDVDIDDLKKWLYRNKMHYDANLITKFYDAVVGYSYSSQERVFVTTTDKEIPVVKSLAGLTYSVSSNLKSDYYYLFATDNERDIGAFIEEVITQDFPQASTRTTGLSCFRSTGKAGILGMFLIGINKDWSKTIIPVGLIAIDNKAPQCGTDNFPGKITKRHSRLSTDEIVNYAKKDIILPEYNLWVSYSVENVPIIGGTLFLETHQFRGDEAQFEVSFNGDIESISIKREIHRDYQRYFMSPGTKTIKLSDKTSPYHFTYALDLGIGDNYIPITVRDKRGNDTTFSYKITMVSTNDDNPQINIDNNISIYE